MELVSVILLMSMVVTPVTFPVIVSVSFAVAFGTKFTSSVTVPPPAKAPLTVRLSSVSLSSPTLSVPPAETRSVPTSIA